MGRMSEISEERKGELLVALAGALWAFFPVITVLSYSWLPALHSLAWSTLFATLIFGAIVVYRRRWPEMRSLTVWKYGFLIAFFLGILFYGFYFIGLETTTPGNAAVLVLFEVFTTSVFFSLFRGEKLPLAHVIGAALMVLGALIILGRGFTGFNTGGLLILIATMFTPIGNLFQQKARRVVSSETIMFMRSLLALPFLFVLAYAVHPGVPLTQVKLSLPILLLSGLILLGVSKLLWIEAIHRISVTKAMALQSGMPLLTLLIAWAVLGQAPEVWQLISLPPLILGVLFLTDQLPLRRT
jgi:drug/metabolite transporter (DMT)-like permease